MARKRQALKCSAHRSDGNACGAWAIVGGTVCTAHGGSAPEVRAAARRRVAEAQAVREFEAAKRRWRADLIKWQAERILVTSRRMGIPVEHVTEADIIACQIIHGVPDKPQPAMRTDRRYGPRRDPRRR